MGLPALVMNQLEAMLISMTIEGAVTFGMVRWNGWSCRGPWHVTAAIMLATAATHPLLWEVALFLYSRLGYEPTLLLTEAVVVLAEAGVVAWITGLPPKQSLVASACANTASVLVGLTLGASRAKPLESITYYDLGAIRSKIIVI